MSASAASKLNGAGASFPAKISQRLFADLAKAGFRLMPPGIWW